VAPFKGGPGCDEEAIGPGAQTGRPGLAGSRRGDRWAAARSAAVLVPRGHIVLCEDIHSRHHRGFSHGSHWDPFLCRSRPSASEPVGASIGRHRPSSPKIRSGKRVSLSPGPTVFFSERMLLANSSRSLKAHGDPFTG
jgi:hypothetical protein